MISFEIKVQPKELIKWILKHLINFKMSHIGQLLFSNMLKCSNICEDEKQHSKQYLFWLEISCKHILNTHVY